MDYPNKGKPWLTAEVDQLKREFMAEDSLQAMIHKHGRTASAITSKLLSLGLVVLLPTGYHRVEQDPWITHTAMRQVYDKEGHQ